MQAGNRFAKRLTMGVLAGLLLLAPLAVVAGAQEDAEPDVEVLEARLSEMVDELLMVDFDGDGRPDVREVDGLPYFVPEGFPGARDIQPGNALFLQEITTELEVQGYNTVVEITDRSELLGDCSGFAMSFDEDGAVQDIAIGLGSKDNGGATGQLIDLYGDGFGERAFTKDNPFQVYERVVYFGTLPRDGDGAREHDWEIKTSGISLDKGGDPNPNGKNRNAGQIDLGQEIDTAFRFTGIFSIEGEFAAADGVLFCNAQGWVELNGDFPLFSAIGAAATAFLAGGIIGLLFNSRPAYTWRA